MDDPVEVFKALGNQTRLEMLTWLRDPEAHFATHAMHPDHVRDSGGVCVGDIQQKAGLSQSTVSHYLQIMQRAGLVVSERHGQWTYYRRNDERLKEVADFITRNF